MLTRVGIKDLLRAATLFLLIAALIVPLAACGGNKDEPSPPPTTESSPESPSPETPESESPKQTPPETPSEEPGEPVETPKSITPVTAIYTNPLDTIAFYDSNFLYEELNPSYKVRYLSHDAFAANEMLDRAFSHWASQMNVEYGGWMHAGGDFNLFIEMLTQLIAEGVDGMLIDPYNAVYNDAAKLLDEAGIPWMSVTTAPRDYTAENTPLLHPYIASPHEVTSTAIAGKLFALKEERFPDVPFEQIALLLVDESENALISRCTYGIIDEWTAQTGLSENCFIADYPTIAPTGSDTPVKEALAQAEGYEYFLVYAYSDVYAETVNNVLDLLGLAPNAAIVAITDDTEDGLGLMFKYWENSQQNAIEAMMYHPTTLRAEAALGALYAFMSGTATPETIWPSWINQNDKGGDTGTYATYCVPYFWLEHDNYKHIVKWTDVYSGANMFPEYMFDVISPYDYEQWRGVPESFN